MKYQLTFRTGVKARMLYNSPEAALEEFIRYTLNSHVELIGENVMGVGRMKSENTPLGTIKAVFDCPISLCDGTVEKVFPLDQEFLVYFYDCGFNGIKAMTLEEIRLMTATLKDATYPHDVCYDEFHYGNFDSVEDLLNCFLAWRIPDNWAKPPFFPVYSSIGVFPDWDSGDFAPD